MNKRTGFTGFGVGGRVPAPPPLTDRELAAAAGDTTALLQQIAENTGKTAGKYVNNPLNQPRIFTIPGSATAFMQFMDLTTLPHNSFVFMVQAGTANLFIGEYTGAGQSDVPNYGQWTAGEKQQFLMEEAGRKYVIVNPSTTVTLTCVLIPVNI